MISKVALKEELVELVAADLDTAERAQQAAREGATHEEAKPENDKDTRALEQTYLARGQAMRVETLVEEIHVLRSMTLRDYRDGDAIGAGALLSLQSEEGTRCVFLLPYGGGVELSIDGAEVLVITPQSALGALVLGRALGDELELRVRGALREYVIAQVA